MSWKFKLPKFKVPKNPTVAKVLVKVVVGVSEFLVQELTKPAKRGK